MKLRMSLILGFVLALSSITGLTWVAAQADGRLNVEGHLGGNAVYCVTAAGNNTYDFNGVGIKVISATGRQLLFADASRIKPLVTAAQAGTLLENTRVRSVPGPYGFGMLELYVLTTGQFQLNGFDEYGKLYEYIWEGCSPTLPGEWSKSNGSSCPVFSTHQEDADIAIDPDQDECVCDYGTIETEDGRCVHPVSP